MSSCPPSRVLRPCQIQSTLSLQVRSVQAQDAASNKEWRELLIEAAMVLLKASNMPIPTVPQWFILSHDLETDSVGKMDVVVRGKWSNSAVMVTVHQGQSDEFVEMIAVYFQLNHPNVVQMSGASHIGPPLLAVFESATSMNLREYLACEENKLGSWQKLLEVALGLQYLIESGFTIDTIRCNSVWATQDGTAKINVLLGGSDDPENLRWQAPEVIRGETPSIASSVYTLGMLALEVLTGDVS